MNELHKKRLVGAFVLVSLGVIFIPMLLDGSEEQGMSASDSPIPAKPEYAYKTIEIPLEIPSATELAQREEPPVVVVTPEEAARLDAGADVIDNSKAATAPAPVAAAPAPRPVAVPAPRASLVQAATPATPKAAAPKPAAAAPESWVVQLGSFGQAANAVALRDKLRAGGYPAFVEQIKVEGGTSYRVRVGPELKREKAETLKAAITEKLGLNGMVMPQP